MQVQEILLNYGLPGIVILGLGYAVQRLYSDLQKTQDARVEDLLSRRSDVERKRRNLPQSCGNFFRVSASGDVLRQA